MCIGCDKDLRVKDRCLTCSSSKCLMFKGRSDFGLMLCATISGVYFKITLSMFHSGELTPIPSMFYCRILDASTIQ